jgi:hypothetical protein
MKKQKFLHNALSVFRHFLLTAQKKFEVLLKIIHVKSPYFGKCP